MSVTTMTRRVALFGLASEAVSGIGLAAAQSPTPTLVDMYRTRGCGCCLVWADHLRRAGFEVKVSELAAKDLDAMKAKAGLKANQVSCHTALISGYTIEGHVPVREIQRLLQERPNAAGLTVPGMPTGSPGMESGTTQEAYDVLLFKADGVATVFASYPARA